MDESNIGAVIALHRKRLAMTQEQLAERVGVSPPAVSKWETSASCPDVALLAHIARALGTDVNALLSFTVTLSQAELLAAVKEVCQLGEEDGAAAMERIRALTRRYPTDAALRFQLASLAMGMPPLHGWPEAEKAAAWDFAEEGLAYVRQHGEEGLRPTATFLLAGLLLNREKLDAAEKLLESLPVLPLAPQTLYAALYQKRGQPEKAWHLARIQLMTGGQTVLQALAMLAASDAPDAGRALEAYGAVAEALGYPPCLLNIQLASWDMEHCDEEAALEKLRSVAEELAGEAVGPGALWGYAAPLEGYAKTLRRMLGNSLRMDARFRSLERDPRFQEILKRLAPEA